MKPTFDIVVYVGILALAVVMSIGWTVRIAQHNQRVAKFAGTLFFAIALIGGLASHLGIFANATAQPPLFVVVAIVLMIGFIGFAISKQGLVFIHSLPWTVLVGLQVFRLPLELFMLRAALVGIMPREFSMLGYNFDVLSGLLSLLNFVYISRTGRAPRAVLWIWNLFGIICLAVIGVLAVLTSPNVHAFGSEPEHLNTWVLHFPYALLPLLLVNFAVMGHVLATRKLLNASS